MARKIIMGSLLALFLTACASQTAVLPPSPPAYVGEKRGAGVEHRAPGSLWADGAGLFEDRRARRVNDLVTVLVDEQVWGSKYAGTSASRSSSYDAAIDNVLGNPLNFNLPNLWGHGNTLSPAVKASAASNFKGDGATSQSGDLIGTITAKVVEVQPNGNLVIESRKEITLNKETQILVLRGIIRPDDVASDNTIPSTRVADAKLFLVGKGVISENQSPGWFARVLDVIWPF